MKNKNSEKRFTFKKLKKLVSNTIWVYKEMFRISKIDTMMLIISSIVMSAVPTIQAFFSAKLIDLIIQIISEGLKQISSINDIRSIFITICIMAISYFAQNISRKIYKYYDEKFKRFHFRHFQLEMTRKISQLDVQQFEDAKVSDSIQKAQDNFYKIQVLTQSSIDFLTQTVKTSIAGVISFTVSPILFVMVTTLAIPNTLIHARFTKNLLNFNNNTVERNRRGWSLKSSLNSESDITEHKIVGSDRFIYDKVKAIFGKLWTEEIQIFKKRTQGELFTIPLNALTYIIIPIVLLQKLLQGQFSIGDFTFYRGRLVDYSSQLDYMFAYFLEMVDISSYITYVRDIFEIKSEIKEGNMKLNPSSPPKIEVKNLSFKYPNAKNYALKNLNLVINPSDEVAIVGENGAGKTTLIKLLLRFYEPTEGQILINGIPIEEYSLKSYYKAFGALFQEYNFYNALDVKDNIAIGKPDEELKLDEVKIAAQSADADTFIERLDNKYDQILSKQFTGGTKLSTGQTQKVAIARMFYRNTPVLILDEPTASIDAQAEYKIFDRIYKFVEDKSVIIISHRFSTVRQAQKIFVLKGGELKESGSHEELMCLNGIYAETFNLQAEGYKKEN